MTIDEKALKAGYNAVSEIASYGVYRECVMAYEKAKDIDDKYIRRRIEDGFCVSASVVEQLEREGINMSIEDSLRIKSEYVLKFIKPYLRSEL